VGIWVRVIEFSGGVVDELRASVDVGRICKAVREAIDRYPVLAGIDEYDDTIFNGRQLGALIAELNTLATTTDDAVLLAAIAEVLRLADLVMPAPPRPTHRRLVLLVTERASGTPSRTHSLPPLVRWVRATRGTDRSSFTEPRGSRPDSHS
jgi:hypothetical protein